MCWRPACADPRNQSVPVQADRPWIRSASAQTWGSDHPDIQGNTKEKVIHQIRYDVVRRDQMANRTTGEHEDSEISRPEEPGEASENAWSESSKLGTTAGAIAGAVTGAVIGSTDSN